MFIPFPLTYQGQNVNSGQSALEITFGRITQYFALTRGVWPPLSRATGTGVGWSLSSFYCLVYK